MISVVVPVYNVEAYLPRCVDSLLGQDIAQPYEIILVDDGSRDRSGALCDEYRAAHPERIRVVHKPNGGLSSARNEGARQAAGEWVTFVDSDDYVSPGYLRVLYGLVEEFGADMSVISLQKTLEGSELTEYTPRVKDFSLNAKDAFYEMYVIREFAWYGVGKLIRREMLLRQPFADGYYEDSATLYRLIDQCRVIAFGDYRAEYHYLERADSITTSRLSEKHLRIFEICGEIAGYIDGRWPEWSYVTVLLYQNAVLQLINRTVMTDEQYDQLFLKYRPMFRKHLLTILRQRRVGLKSKYYAVVLCLTPRFCRLQRALVTKLAGRRV